MRLLTGPEDLTATVSDPLTDDDLKRLYAAPQDPWLRANMIATVDGAATGESGKSGSINNHVDQRVFDTLRALADVAVVGAGTARTEGYRALGLPLVLVTRTGRIPEHLLGAPAGSVVVATCSRAERLGELRERLGADQVLVLGSHRVDLAELRTRLVDRGWRQILCEGGPHLLRDLLGQGVVDELAATVVPRVVAGTHPRITDGAPVDVPLELRLLVEEDGTLLGRWFT